MDLSYDTEQTILRDSAEKFLAKALTEYDNGNISEEVFNVIKVAYDKYPDLLDGLLLSVKAPGLRNSAAGQFLPWERIVRLFKGTSGVYDPVTIRHELTHTLEQMMTPEQRMAVVQTVVTGVKSCCATCQAAPPSASTAAFAVWWSSAACGNGTRMAAVRHVASSANVPAPARVTARSAAE